MFNTDDAAQLSLEPLFLDIRVGAVTARQTPTEGAIPTYPISVLTGEGWGRAWRIDYSIEPGTLLPEGVHRVDFSCRVASPGETPVNASGSFFVSVGDKTPPPRTLSFTDDDGNPVSAPYEWRFQLPASIQLPVFSVDDNISYINRCRRYAETARTAAIERCAPAIRQYARERESFLSHLPSTTLDDLAQVAWGVAFRGVDLFSSPERPRVAFSHWLYLEARKSIKRSIAKTQGISLDAMATRHLMSRAKERGLPVNTPEEVQSMALREMLEEQYRNEGCTVSVARERADKHLEDNARWEEAFEVALEEHLDWLSGLGSVSDETFRREVVQYLCASGGVSLEDQRMEIVGWLYANAENSAAAAVMVSGLPRPVMPTIALSQRAAEVACSSAPDVSLDALHDSGAALPALSPFEELEMRMLLEERFSDAGVCAAERAVFLARTNVLTNGEEETWEGVIEILGLTRRPGGPSRQVMRCLGVVFRSCKAKLTGEDFHEDLASALRSLDRAAVPGAPWFEVVAEDNILVSA